MRYWTILAGSLLSLAVAGCNGGSGSPCPSATAPDVTGTWCQMGAATTESTCSAGTNSLNLTTANGTTSACSFTVGQSGSAVVISSCNQDVAFTGCVDSAGAISADYGLFQAEPGCTVTAPVTLKVEPGAETATASYDFPVSYDGLACTAGSMSCRGQIGAQWQRYVCGDGAATVACEECDDGNSDNSDDCKNDCTLNVCGDGVLHVGVEECDDGNNRDGDGCSAACKIEMPSAAS